MGGPVHEPRRPGGDPDGGGQPAGRRAAPVRQRHQTAEDESLHAGCAPDARPVRLHDQLHGRAGLQFPDDDACQPAAGRELLRGGAGQPLVEPVRVDARGAQLVRRPVPDGREALHTRVAVGIPDRLHARLGRAEHESPRPVRYPERVRAFLARALPVLGG